MADATIKLTLIAVADAAVAAMRTLSRRIDATAAAGKNFASADGAKKISGAAQTASRAVKKLGADIAASARRGASWAASKGISALKWGLAGLTAAFLVAGGAVVKFGAEQEQTRLKLQTMLGSVARGNAMLAQMQQFAKVTPFNTDEVVKAGSTLLSFGVASDKIQSSLKMIGDVSAGSGKKLEELASIYGKVMTKGKADTEALNQMAEAGIPIIAILAKQYGVAGEEVYEMAARGEISAAAISTAFKSMTDQGGIFANMMDTQSKTVGGLWSTLMGNIETAAAKLGEQLAPAFTAVLNYLISWSDKLDEIVSDGSMVEYLANIARVGLTAFGELVITVGSFVNNSIAAFLTLKDWAMVVWHGIKAGLLLAITAMIAQVETFINVFLTAYNATIGKITGKKIDVNFTWTKAAAETAKDSAKDTAAYKEATSNNRGADADAKNNSLRQTVNGKINAWDEAIRKFAENNAKKIKEQNTKDESKKDTPAKAIIPSKGTELKSMATDSLSKIGLYNFGKAAINSLDKERNKLLQTIANGVTQRPAEVVV